MFVPVKPFQPSLGTNALKLIMETVTYGHNKFYDSGPWSQPYKMFLKDIYVLFWKLEPFIAVRILFIALKQLSLQRKN